MKRRPIIYVAGPFNGPDAVQVFTNMREGIEMSYHILKKGCAPFCPWLDYHFTLHGPMEYEEYLDYSMAFLEVSDAVILLPRWLESEGAKKEARRATQLKIPTFVGKGGFEIWLSNRRNALR